MPSRDTSVHQLCPTSHQHCPSFHHINSASSHAANNVISHTATRHAICTVTTKIAAGHMDVICPIIAPMPHACNHNSAKMSWQPEQTLWEAMLMALEKHTGNQPNPTQPKFLLLMLLCFCCNKHDLQPPFNLLQLLTLELQPQHNVAICGDPTNVHPMNNPITVNVFNGNKIESTHECTLPLPTLPAKDLLECVLPSPHCHSLVSIATLVNNGSVIMHTPTKVLVCHQQKMIL